MMEITSSDSAGGSAAPLTGRHREIYTDHEAVVPPDEQRPIRKRPAHMSNIERHNESIIVFVTVCTKGRRAVLANPRVHTALVNVWPNATQYCVGHYMIMPDHIHLFCSPSAPDAENVCRWVSYWKRLACLNLGESTGFWQRDGWDTQLRRAQDYEDKWSYVAENPVRAGLVKRAEDWPYQGVINELRW